MFLHCLQRRLAPRNEHSLTARAAVLFDSAVSAQPNGTAFKERVPALVLEGGGIRRKLVASEPLADVLFLNAAQAVAPGCIESCRKVCIKFERNCSYTTLYSTHA